VSVSQQEYRIKYTRTIRENTERLFKDLLCQQAQKQVEQCKLLNRRDFSMICKVNTRQYYMHMDTCSTETEITGRPVLL
jgi:hypothetical protein